MTRFSAGIVMTGSDGYVHVRIWDKSYFICPEDMGMLLFVGETVPLLQKNPDQVGSRVASGSVALNPSGRAVIMSIGSIRYMLPAIGSSRSRSARTYPASSSRSRAMCRNRR